jgi:deoxyribodipyrimidine photo-lyase
MTTNSIIENTDHRVQLLNSAPFRASAKYVLYWARVNRRASCNRGLAHAVELANQAGLQVLFYEGLTFDYPYASDRFDRFILEGVPDSTAPIAPNAKFGPGSGPCA